MVAIKDNPHMLEVSEHGRGCTNLSFSALSRSRSTNVTGPITNMKCSLENSTRTFATALLKSCKAAKL